MKAFRWFHSIDLGDGVVTPGLKKADRLKFQADHVFRFPIAGQSVLDIGCWDGYFSFEARRRGASRALATDHHVWSGPGWGDKAAFDFARECVDPAVEVKDIAFEEMTPENVGVHDVVLFLGVLYHMKNPLAAIERAAALARRMLVVETHVDLRLPQEPPSMVFYPFKELNNDASNWWGPNPSCVIAMLKTCGFDRIEHDVEYAAGGNSRGLFHAMR